MAFLRLSLLFLFFVSSTAIDGPFPSDGWRSEKEVRNIYQSWVAEHGKTYTTGEEGKRFNIFKENLRFIDEHNNNTNRPYKLGLTIFADLTNEEYNERYVGKLRVPAFRRMAARDITGLNYTVAKTRDGLPKWVDWRQKNAVTPVKNQTPRCGACWAFAAVAAIEGIHKIKTGSLISFSEQQIIDCDTEQNSGCKYGFVDYTLVHLSKNKVRLHTEADYPYVAKQGKCNLSNKPNQIVATITGLVNVRQSDEFALKKAVAQQPCTASLDASSKLFQFYRSGVLTAGCGNRVDHSAAVIGYGRERGLDYWLVKNSYGAQWGESGFIRIQRNVPSEKFGRCGITLDAAYPLMN